MNWILFAVLFAVPLMASAFPQARAGAWLGALSCVAWFDSGAREVKPVSPRDPQAADETAYAGICRYDLTGIAAGNHTIQWALIYAEGESGRGEILAFVKPPAPVFESQITPTLP
jgi:hypothetical protein